MPRALLSVSDKTGVAAFARVSCRARLRSWSRPAERPGRSARRGSRWRTLPIVTGVPEMLDGRVKTLHPAVHGGLLARRDRPEHLATLAEHGIAPIDVIAVNLYPFRETAARSDVSRDEVVEQIDIGGPAMLRSAAKNFDAVTVVVDPADYPAVLDALGRGGDAALRRRLAGKVYAHTAAYDAAIAAWFEDWEADEDTPAAQPLGRFR